jgi:integrase/recombinase XerD
MLSPALPEELRRYWRWHTSSRPITTKVLWLACQQAALRAGLEHKHAVSTLCDQLGAVKIQH